MVCEDCGNIIGDQVIPGLRHALPADQVQVHPAASKPIDFPIFVAGTEIVVEGDKIVEVTSPRGRKILQLNSGEEDREEDNYQDNYQQTTSSSVSQVDQSQLDLGNEVEVEGESESGPYPDPFSAVEMVVEDNDPFNRLVVDVIMLEDSPVVSHQENGELVGPLSVGQGEKFQSEDLIIEAGKEMNQLTVPIEVSRMMTGDMTGQSTSENDPTLARLNDSPEVIEASQIKLTSSNFWEVDEIITEPEVPQKVAEIEDEPLSVAEPDEVMAMEPHTVPKSDDVHKDDNARAVGPPVVDVDNVQLLDPPVLPDVGNCNVLAQDTPVVPVGQVKALDPIQAPEDPEVSVLDPEESPGRLQIQPETAPPVQIKVKPLMTLQQGCFRCGSVDSTGPWHKHKRRENSYLCHLCFSYYR